DVQLGAELRTFRRKVGLRQTVLREDRGVFACARPADRRRAASRRGVMIDIVGERRHALVVVQLGQRIGLLAQAVVTGAVGFRIRVRKQFVALLDRREVGLLLRGIGCAGVL